MPEILKHPDRFKAGTRVLFLKGRHKDGLVEQRMFSRVSNSIAQFDKMLSELLDLQAPHERIYASADPRSVSAAARHFKHAQVDAEHAEDPEDFYRHLQARWVSSLMQPTSRAEKLWLFDCDDADMRASIYSTLGLNNLDVLEYDYPTKSGHHIITRTFDRRVLSAAEFGAWNDNALMLWAY